MRVVAQESGAGTVDRGDEIRAAFVRRKRLAHDLADLDSPIQDRSTSSDRRRCGLDHHAETGGIRAVLFGELVCGAAEALGDRALGSRRAFDIDPAHQRFQTAHALEGNRRPDEREPGSPAAEEVVAGIEPRGDEDFSVSRFHVLDKTDRDAKIAELGLPGEQPLAVWKFDEDRRRSGPRGALVGKELEARTVFRRLAGRPEDIECHPAFPERLDSGNLDIQHPRPRLDRRRGNPPEFRVRGERPREFLPDHERQRRPVVFVERFFFDATNDDSAQEDGRAFVDGRDFLRMERDGQALFLRHGLGRIASDKPVGGPGGVAHSAVDIDSGNDRFDSRNALQRDARAHERERGPFSPQALVAGRQPGRALDFSGGNIGVHGLDEADRHPAVAQFGDAGTEPEPLVKRDADRLPADSRGELVGAKIELVAVLRCRARLAEAVHRDGTEQERLEPAEVDLQRARTQLHRGGWQRPEP